jgi:hypothetical protein
MMVETSTREWIVDATARLFCRTPRTPRSQRDSPKRDAACRCVTVCQRWMLAFAPS